MYGKSTVRYRKNSTEFPHHSVTENTVHNFIAYFSLKFNCTVLNPLVCVLFAKLDFFNELKLRASKTFIYGCLHTISLPYYMSGWNSASKKLSEIPLTIYRVV